MNFRHDRSQRRARTSTLLQNNDVGQYALRSLESSNSRKEASHDICRRLGLLVDQNAAVEEPLDEDCRC